MVNVAPAGASDEGIEVGVSCGPAVGLGSGDNDGFAIKVGSGISVTVVGEAGGDWTAVEPQPVRAMIFNATIASKALILIGMFVLLKTAYAS
jgi:hypothetical protein